MNEKAYGKIAIASDHAGYKIKDVIKRFFKESGYEFADFGTGSDDSVDYPDFAFRVAKDVSSGEAKSGILVCGTGLGMCIAANKVKGIRAVTVHDKFTAEMSRRHNDANILCLGARTLNETDIKGIVKTWLETPFDVENLRHQRRLRKILDYEEK